MKWTVVAAALVTAMTSVPPAYTAGPSEDNIRQAYRMILSQADANKDGKLSAAECMAIYKDKNTAEKNCSFWDVDKDGIITEDEYVQQALNIGKKK
jgi:Ca2+-binding EF-hand superfamily protein